MYQCTIIFFVLWDHGFEEFGATVFVTQFREAGLPVKLVELLPGQINGAHGFALIPDCKLGKALSLAPKARCVIIPSLTLESNQFKNDPRLSEFFELACSNQAKFVVGYRMEEFGIANGEPLPQSPEQVLVYPDQEDLVPFVRELVGLLAR